MNRSRWALALLILILPGASEGFAEEALTDCRYQTRGAEKIGRGAFPADDVFRPLLADVKEPRFSATYRRVRFRTRGVLRTQEDDEINAGIASLGDTFGLWTARRPGTCTGAQVGILGAVFSQFDLDAPSSDLLNSDFVVGLPLSLRYGPLSARLRVYHQSSHLGDEFLLRNPDVQRQNLSFETVDSLLSLDLWWLRLYGGGGYLVRTEPDLAEGIAQWGAELRAEGWSWTHERWRLRAVPTAGVDFKSFEEQDWEVTTSVVAGPELARSGGTRRIRIVFVYLRGFIPFGQFFNREKIETFGVGVQFEL